MKAILGLNSLLIFLLASSVLVAQIEAKTCPVCKRIVASFNQGFKRTEKQNFGGGNTDWEKRKLGDYATSETRLTEILDGVCEGKDHDCYSILEEGEEVIEEWWNSKDRSSKDLIDLLCSQHFKLCCPDGHYGPKCTPCPGPKDHPCWEHGACNGAGTTKGTGKCACHSQYTGKECEICKEGYYRHEYIDGAFKCEPCHASCEKCSGPAASMCLTCKSGYTKQGSECVDNDECQLGTANCTVGTYCSNTLGGFDCLPCDSACLKEQGCAGAGNRNCTACASGYENVDGTCIDVNECSTDNRCEEGKFCSNLPGTFECRDCDHSCQGGCTAEGPKGCSACRTGYEKTEDQGCQDIDECTSSPCAETFTCINNPGNHECICISPLSLVDGKCVDTTETSTSSSTTTTESNSGSKDEL